MKQDMVTIKPGFYVRCEVCELELLLLYEKVLKEHTPAELAQLTQAFVAENRANAWTLVHENGELEIECPGCGARYSSVPEDPRDPGASGWIKRIQC